MDILPPDFKMHGSAFFSFSCFFQRFLLQIDMATESYRTDDSLGFLPSCPLYVVGSLRQLLPPFPSVLTHLTVGGICVPQGMLNAL